MRADIPDFLREAVSHGRKSDKTESGQFPGNPYREPVRICKQMKALHSSFANSVRKRLNRSSSAAPFFVSHSHITRTLHPASTNDLRFRASLALFPSNLGIQNSSLDFGSRPRAHPSCMCQKQPLTNMAFFLFRKTISGFPGKSRI